MLTTLVLATAAAAYGPDVPFPIGEPRERFVYNREDRRDPFLFRRKPELGEPPGIFPYLPEAPRPRPEPSPPPEIEAGRLIEEIKKALEERDYRGAKRLVKWGRRRAGEDGLPDLAQRLEDLQRTVDPLIERKRTEEEFANLALRIDAIFWRPDEPLAMINGRAYHEGDVLDNRLQIYKIEKGGVVFLYKFLKVHKRLDWGLGLRKP